MRSASRKCGTWFTVCFGWCHVRVRMNCELYLRPNYSTLFLTGRFLMRCQLHYLTQLGVNQGAHLRLVRVARYIDNPGTLNTALNSVGVVPEPFSVDIYAACPIDVQFRSPDAHPWAVCMGKIFCPPLRASLVLPKQSHNHVASCRYRSRY